MPTYNVDGIAVFARRSRGPYGLDCINHMAMLEHVGITIVNPALLKRLYIVVLAKHWGCPVMHAANYHG